MELTLQQAKANAGMLFYIFADEDKFLKLIEPKYATIIRGKKANQNKLLELSAKKYGGTYEEYANAVRDGFIEQFGVTPAQALVTLANGGEVAGKNWSEGVYGVGSLSKSFKGTDITVNEKNGYMMRNGKLLPVYDTVYADVKGKSVAYQLFYYDEASGNTYMSQYNKTLKKYYAQSYSDKDGKKYNASGREINNSQVATNWESVLLSLQTFVDWIISLFGGDKANTELITESNTLPNQKTDGFVYQSGFGEAGTILLALAAGGMIMGGGLNVGNKKSK